MKFKGYLTLLTLFAATLVQSQISIRPSETSTRPNCTNCTDQANDITILTGNRFRARHAQAYYWEICQGNGTIIGSNTSRIVEVSCPSDSNNRIKLTRFQGGNCIESCEIFTCEVPDTSCSAEVIEIYCNSNNGPFEAQYPVRVNSRIRLFNPFNTSASVTFSWDPAFFSGNQLAGGVLNNFPANAVDTKSSQFVINANGTSDNNPTGFFVPLKVVYTNNVTGATCTVNLNPLLQPCDDDEGGELVVDGSNNQDTKSRIYPNPYSTGDKMTIESKNIIRTVELLDFNGTKISDYKLNDNQFIINENINTGVYFLKYLSNGNPKVKRFIIK